MLLPGVRPRHNVWGLVSARRLFLGCMGVVMVVTCMMMSTWPERLVLLRLRLGAVGPGAGAAVPAAVNFNQAAACHGCACHYVGPFQAHVAPAGWAVGAVCCIKNTRQQLIHGGAPTSCAATRASRETHKALCDSGFAIRPPGAPPPHPKCLLNGFS